MKNNRKGFSLVELLAVIVILGLLSAIGIGVTSSLIDRAKSDEMDALKNTVTMSAESYMQNNKNLVPKIVGEKTVVKLSDLRAANYLTEDIKNNKGETCIEKSYVRVYKLSNSEYTYTTYLYCGSEEVPAEEVVPSPKIVAKFSDSTGEAKDVNLNNVSDAYLFIEINAATDAEITSYKNQGTHITIDGYSFKIFVVKDTVKQEAYNSGSLSGGRQEKLIINKRLDDYIDVTGVTEASIEVTAINTVGGITNINTTVGEHGETSSTVYDDNVPPKCVKPDSPFSENDWLNKEEYNLTKEPRKLTVGCDDGTGSQCIRSYFTKSWPNDSDDLGAEYVYITVKDNAGNESLKTDECRFRVNVDIQTPEATVTAYAGKAANANDTNTLSTKLNGANLLKKTINVSDTKVSTKIGHTDEFYSNLVGNNTDIKWMNNANYPNGVIYKIELKDNIRLDKWTWETNAGYINSDKANNYKSVSLSNPEANSEVIPQDSSHGMTHFHGSVTDTVYVRFLTEGMRYGVFTAYDKAGNSVKIEIAANLDRTAPPIPNTLNAYVYNAVRTSGTSPSSTTYDFSTWTNRYVRVQTGAGQNRDDLTQNVTLSGFWQYYYEALNNGGTRVGNSDYSTYSSGVGTYDFKGTAAQVDGKNKIRFMGCDKAGNCSDWGTQKQVWIDITIPVCSVTKTTNGSESSWGWLGSGETARVTATCNDPTSTLASGCTVSSFHYNYTSPINTNTAGAEGNNKAGSFTDYAGNTVNCTANQRIQIDYTYPTCSVSGGSSSWTNSSRTVTGTCSDSGGSGCAGNISHTYNYDIKTSSGGAAGNGNGGSVRDRADNYVSCAANQTVKVDRTNPYVTVTPEPKIYDTNSGITITITCHDDLSGLNGRFDTSYTSTLSSPSYSGNTYYIGKCCEDNAGNLVCPDRGPYQTRYYSRHSSCGVEQYKSCATSACGVASYKSCRTSACGVASYKSCSNSSCGWKTCPSGYQYNCTACGSCGNAGGVYVSNSYKSCTSPSCGVSSYNSCRNSACGVESYKTCRASACGVDYYKNCWHFK